MTGFTMWMSSLNPLLIRASIQTPHPTQSDCRNNVLEGWFPKNSATRLARIMHGQSRLHTGPSILPKAVAQDQRSPGDTGPQVCPVPLSRRASPRASRPPPRCLRRLPPPLPPGRRRCRAPNRSRRLRPAPDGGRRGRPEHPRRRPLGGLPAALTYQRPVVDVLHRTPPESHRGTIAYDAVCHAASIRDGPTILSPNRNVYPITRPDRNARSLRPRRVPSGT